MKKYILFLGIVILLFCTCKTSRSYTVRIAETNDSICTYNNLLIIVTGTRSCTGCKENLLEFIQSRHTIKKSKRILICGGIYDAVRQFQCREQYAGFFKKQHILFLPDSNTATLVSDYFSQSINVTTARTPIVILIKKERCIMYDYDFIFNDMLLNPLFIAKLKHDIHD